MKTKKRSKSQNYHLIFLKIINLKNVLMFMLVVGFIGIQQVCAQLIPQDRIITWEGNVGVEGGIPERTTIYTTLNASTYGNGANDATPAIQTALDNCPSDQVVYLSAGTYRLGSTVSLGSQVTLRGAGQDQTILLADNDIDIAIMIGVEHRYKSAIDIVSGYTKGSTQLVLADASSLNVGKHILIDELNESSIPVDNTGVGTCSWCSRENGTRARAQVVRITAIEGNTITISPSMYFNFSSNNNPQVVAMGAWTTSGMESEFSGVEDMTIENSWNPDKVKGTDGKEYSAMHDHTSDSDTKPVTGVDWNWAWVVTSEDGSGLPDWQSNTDYDSDYSSRRMLIRTSHTANCWVKNVKIERCGARCMELFDCNFRFEIRNCYITKCLNRWDSNNCYGTMIGMYTSGLLIENNVFDAVADGPMFGWTASGNVVGYNYMYDNHRTNVQKGWFLGIGASHHGAHTTFNLWEGNELEAVYFDQYWGSHSHNTLFRNRVLGKYMIDGIAIDDINNVQTVGTERNVRYQNYLGNVFGTSGYHDTYEINSIDCPNEYADKLIYRTGYASSGNCEQTDSDPEVFNTMLRHMNYDYVTNSVKQCGTAGEPPCQGGDGSSILPASLYLSSKPAFFGNCAWPSIGADLDPMVGTLPAKEYFLDPNWTDCEITNTETSDLKTDR